MRLPRTVQPYRLRIDTYSAIRRGIEKVQKAVAQLRGIEELPHVQSIETLTPEWAQASIADNISATRSDKTLTVTARGERLKEWRKIQTTAEQLTEIVQSFIGEFPEVIWCLDPKDGTVSVSEDNINRIVDGRSTVAVPEEAVTHWEKLQSIIEAIRDLREWEKAQGVEPCRIENAVNCTPYQFAELWASKTNAIDHRFDHYRTPNNKMII